MHRRQALKLFGALALCPLCAPAGFAAEGHHWSYEGAEGPAKWGDLDAANKACSVGTQQSPVDIGDTIKAQLPPLKMTWAKSADTIVNNGHTIQLNMGDSSILSVGGGGNYRMVQFHFHRPSEHTINGASFPMEVHFVHQNAAGALAVVGVLMTTGKPNRAFTTIVLTMPNREGPPEKADPKIDPNAFLPAKRSITAIPGRSPRRPAARQWTGSCSPTQSRWRRPTSPALPGSIR
jgi:carbonic anhydrase